MLEEINAPAPGNVGAVLERNADIIDKAQGAGAADIIQKVTLNLGVIQGGLKVNMIPSECIIEADVRLPVGLEKERVLDEIDKILVRFPRVEMEEINFSAPNWCDPEGEMVGILRANVKQLRGIEPAATVSLGATDTRLWRYQDVPAYVYGPFPTGMGSWDEHVDIEEFLHIVRAHVMSAYDYLTSG